VGRSAALIPFKLKEPVKTTSTVSSLGSQEGELVVATEGAAVAGTGAAEGELVVAGTGAAEGELVVATEGAEVAGTGAAEGELVVATEGAEVGAGHAHKVGQDPSILLLPSSSQQALQ